MQSQALAGSFSSHIGSILAIGQSRSTWWIRIKLENRLVGYEPTHLTINNPTIEKAVLYLPILTETGVHYKTLRSGWGFQGNTQDEGFIYPVFRLDDTVF
ncbi:MAG: hypothetical protein M0T74_03495 [Desulfitobacterium hafniense]|nr:hypothetical protein [Desulfitobacterium hafniense]